MAVTSLTQSLALETKQYLENAHEQQDTFATHLMGRVKLIGITIVGTVELITRLAFFFLGHIAGVFCLYQSNEINQFLKDQTQAGFSASIITSAGLFSLLAPDLFRGVLIAQERDQEDQNPAFQPLNEIGLAPEPLNVIRQNIAPRELIDDEEIDLGLINRAVPLRESDIEERITNLILDVVMLPFKMVAFFFKLPFYCIYLSFQLGFVLPVRLALLPFQIFLNALTLERPRVNFELDLF